MSGSVVWVVSISDLLNDCSQDVDWPRQGVPVVQVLGFCLPVGMGTKNLLHFWMNSSAAGPRQGGGFESMAGVIRDVVRMVDQYQSHDVCDIVCADLCACNWHPVLVHSVL